jgi:hypothetical protein
MDVSWTRSSPMRKDMTQHYVLGAHLETASRAVGDSEEHNTYVSPVALFHHRVARRRAVKYERRVTVL